MRYVWLTLGLMTLVGMVVGTILLLKYTLLSPWVLFCPVGLAALAAAVFVGKYFRWITGMGNRLVNSAAAFAIVFIVLGFGFLAINYFPTDFTPTARGETRGIVERRYQQTRYQSHRTGRRTYSQGAPYQVYFLEVALPEWGSRDFEVTKKRYDSVRSGDTVTIALRRGALGLPVVNPATLEPLHPRSKSNRSRCRFFGTSSK